MPKCTWNDCVNSIPKCSASSSIVCESKQQIAFSATGIFSTVSAILNIWFVFQVTGRVQRMGIIYRCHKYCGGLGDRFRGMAAALWLAFALDVPLHIHWDHITLSDWLEPNIYDWQPLNVSLMEKPILATDIARKNFEAIPALRQQLAKTLNGKASTVLTLNTIEVLHIFARDRGDLALTQLGFRRVLAGSLTDDNFESKIMQFAFHMLFRPTAQLSAMVTFYRNTVLKTCCHPYNGVLHYVTMHLRFGGSPESSEHQLGFSDSYSLIDPARIGDIATCMDNLTATHDACILVVSDNADAKIALTKAVNSRVCALNTSVSHVDRSHDAGSDQYDKAVADMFLEWSLLSSADGYIAVVESGFARTAYMLPQWTERPGSGMNIAQVGSCCNRNISLQRPCEQASID